MPVSTTLIPSLTVEVQVGRPPSKTYKLRGSRPDRRYFKTPIGSCRTEHSEILVVQITHHSTHFKLAKVLWPFVGKFIRNLFLSGAATLIVRDHLQSYFFHERYWQPVGAIWRRLAHIRVYCLLYYMFVLDEILGTSYPCDRYSTTVALV